MVSLRRHFVPNPVVIHSTCRGSRRRQPLSIHTRYDDLGYSDAETINIGGLTPDVILSSTYDYNGERLSLAANIGGEISGGSVVGGTPDFINNYTYNALGDMTDVTQQGQGGNAAAPKNVVLSYDADSRLTGISRYASTDTGVPAAGSTYTYDDDSRLTDLSYTAQSSTLAAYHWSYNSDSEVPNAYSFKDTSGSPSPSSYANWAETSYSYLCPCQLAGADFLRPVCRRGSQGTGRFNFAHSSMAA